MTLSFEVWLVLGVAGFYLFDSAMLLYFNELVFAETNGKWGFAYPDSRWQILGKNTYLPNPLRPDNPLFRVCWSVSETGERQEDQQALRHFLVSLYPLKCMTLGLYALLFVGLPILLFGFGSGFGLLMLMAVVYLTIAVMLIQIFRQREELGLPGKAFAKLAFDSLVCAPFALNLVRKITLRRSLRSNPIFFAHEFFDAATFAQLVHALCQRVDEEIKFEDEASSRYSALKDYRNRIASMVS